MQSYSSYSSYSTESRPRSYDRPQQGGYRNNNYSRNQDGGYQRRDNYNRDNRSQQGGYQRKMCIRDSVNTNKAPNAPHNKFKTLILYEINNSLKRINSLTAVSYTHLDVYKRQRHISSPEKL